MILYYLLKHSFIPSTTYLNILKESKETGMDVLDFL